MSGDVIYCLCPPWSETGAALARGYGLTVHRLACACCRGPLLACAATVALIDSGRARPVCAACFDEPTTGLVMTAAQAEELRKVRRGMAERN